MKLCRERETYTDDNGVVHPYYQIYIVLENGDLIAIKPIFKKDKTKLTATAVDLERN